MEPVLAYDELSLDLETCAGPLRALQAVSLHVQAHEIVGLVGESGSGKSLIAMSALRLLPRGRFRVAGGRLTLLGRDVMALAGVELETLRGAEAAVIFQEPMNALNPTLRVGEQIAAVLRRHQGLSQAEALQRAQALLGEMRIEDPARVMWLYPAALSGGMRQRVLLAMAFACDPKVLICDEPTTALDVTVQAQVLALIRDRARRLGTSVLFISHDMAVVGQLCDRIYVLYAGEVVETGPTAEVIAAPRHPYTRALLAASPAGRAPKSELAAIEGAAPSLADPPDGCRFRPRCGQAMAACLQRPSLQGEETDHTAACWLAAAPQDGDR